MIDISDLAVFVFIKEQIKRGGKKGFDQLYVTGFFKKKRKLRADVMITIATKRLKFPRFQKMQHKFAL
jgi:hypothetical protein